MSLLSSVGSFFGNLFKGAGSVAFQLEEFELGIFKTFFAIQDDVQAFVKNLENFKSFDFDPKFATRVISVPKAKQQILALVDKIRTDLVDKGKEVVKSVEALVQFVEGKTGSSGDAGPSAAGDFASKLATISLLLQQIQQAFHSALEIETLLSQIKSDIEGLDSLFLQQGNSRRAVTEHSRIRLGKLHGGG